MKRGEFPLALIVLGLSKESIMKSLQKLFSRVVTFPKWVLTFDLKISFVPRTYGVYWLSGKSCGI